MPGPWEKYSSQPQSTQTSSGPWSKYASQSAIPAEPIGTKSPASGQILSTPAPKGFLESAIDSINPIPAIRDFYSRPSQFARATQSLADGSDPQLQGPEGSPVPSLAQPLATAGGQLLNEGNIPGALGTLAGSYGIPLAGAKLKSMMDGPGYTYRLSDKGKKALSFAPLSKKYSEFPEFMSPPPPTDRIPTAFGLLDKYKKVEKTNNGVGRTALWKQTSTPEEPVVTSLPEDGWGASPEQPPAPSLPVPELPSGRKVGPAPVRPEVKTVRPEPPWKSITPKQRLIQDLTPIQSEGLPSGRKIGPAPAKPEPVKPPRTDPSWKSINLETAPVPDLSSIPSSALPSGRKAGPAPPSLPTPAPPSRVPLWKDITSNPEIPDLKSQQVNPIQASSTPSGRVPGNRPVSLPSPDEIKAAGYPLTPEGIQKFTADKGVIQSQPPSPVKVTSAPVPASKWPNKVITEEGLKEYAESNGIDAFTAQKQLANDGYGIMGRPELNRLLHAIGAELGMDHPTLSEVSRLKFGSKSMAKLSQEQMLQMYNDLLSHPGLNNPIANKTGALPSSALPSLPRPVPPSSK